MKIYVIDFPYIAAFPDSLSVYKKLIALRADFWNECSVFEYDTDELQSGGEFFLRNLSHAEFWVKRYESEILRREQDDVRDDGGSDGS